MHFGAATKVDGDVLVWHGERQSHAIGIGIVYDASAGEVFDRRDRL